MKRRFSALRVLEDVIIRLYRRFARPFIVSRTLFAYDRKRFSRHAGCFDLSSRGSSLARIIMAYHVLEKGMTMPHRRLDFGHAAVLNLIELVEDFERKFGAGELQVDHAIGCVKEYLGIHVTAGFDISKNKEYWNRVESFCTARGTIPCARQVVITRGEFFAHNDAPFPAFAASRHTVRHYEGMVDIERIKSAIKLAMTAPSACNRQFVKVYCISNHEIRDKVLELQNGNRGFGAGADKLLVITADLSGSRWAEERNDLYTNAGIFIMNLCYALHYHKIAHCILNWSVPPGNDIAGHKLLGIPENEVMTVAISCGNAPESFPLATSPRKGLNDIFREIQ